MKPGKLQSLVRGVNLDSLRSDRLTRPLIAVVFLLAALAAALAADIWLSSSTDGLSALLATPLPTATPTVTPTPGTPPPCIAPYDWGSHIVHRGDTLYDLALQYNTEVDTLMKVNCLDGSTILVNQRLYVPGPLAQPTFATSTPGAAVALLSAGTPQPGDLVTEASQEVATPMPVAGSTATPKGGFRLNIPDRYLNVVLLGSDLRPKERTSKLMPRHTTDTWRTDAIIIVSLDVKDNTVRALNIPRDLYVYIPDHGYDKINTAHMWAEFQESGTGPERVKQTIYRNLGIPVHYYVEMDFQGFVDIIDAIGGIDVDVVCPLPEFEIEPGVHHFDGLHALRYVQSRETASDYDRGRRQRKMLMALWEQALTPEIIPRVPQLWVAMADSFETDIPLGEAIKLAQVGLQIRPEDIEMKAITNKQAEGTITPEGLWALIPDEEKIRELLESFYAPTDKTQQDETEKVRVQVLNGWQLADAEELAGAALRRRGFRVVDKDLADHQDYAETEILIYEGDPAEGERIADELGVPLTAVQNLVGVSEPPDTEWPIHIRVILGKDYDPCQR